MVRIYRIMAVNQMANTVYVRICDGRQMVGYKTKRYDTGTRIKRRYSHTLTVTVRSPTLIVPTIKLA